MLYSVRGTMTYLQPRLAVVECGGVGFRCQITENTARQLPKIGEEAFLFTMLNVREDAIEVFGFATQMELDSFKMLTTVKGVGPRVGLAILSGITPEKVALGVASDDYKVFTAAPGVGPKLAQRIVLELKDKFKDISVDASGIDMSGGAAVSASSNAQKAVMALSALGFTAGEASAAVGKLDSSLSTEELVRMALRSLGQR